MDKTASPFYFSAMLRVWMIIFWMISFVAVSFTASAHETGMVASKEYGVRMQHMAHASPSKASCSDNDTCSEKAGLCDLVCTGVGVFLPLDPTSAYAISLEEKYLSRPEANLVATAPGRNDRPPILRFL